MRFSPFIGILFMTNLGAETIFIPSPTSPPVRETIIIEQVPAPTPFPSTPYERLKEAQRQNFKSDAQQRQEYKEAIEMKDAWRNRDYLLKPHPLEHKPLPRKRV